MQYKHIIGLAIGSLVIGASLALSVVSFLYVWKHDQRITQTEAAIGQIVSFINSNAKQ